MPSDSVNAGAARNKMKLNRLKKIILGKVTDLLRWHNQGWPLIRPSFNPMEDEKKEYSLAEFTAIAKASLDKYQEDWSPPNQSNDWHEGKHTYYEWYNSFNRYMSW